MELNGTRIIPATVEQTWAALNNPEVLKRCINGCESLERMGEDGLQAVVALKVGPVSARFKGSVKLLNVQAPNSYTLQFDGQGGVAGFGKGSADVSLLPAPEAAPGHTQLSYAARATVGGKMAQVGSRLVDAAAGKITEDFFTAFEAVLREMHATPAEEAAPAATAATAAPAVTAAPAALAPPTPPAVPDVPAGPAQVVVSPFERAVALASPTHAAAAAEAAAMVAAVTVPVPAAAPAPAPVSAPVSASAAAPAAVIPTEPAPASGNGLKWAAVAVLAALVLYFVLR